MTAARAMVFSAAAAVAWAQAQPSGDEIMRKVGEKYAGAKKYELAVSIVVTSTREEDGSLLRQQTVRMHMALDSPDKVLFEGVGLGEDGSSVYSDGKAAWVYSPAKNQYMAVKPAGGSSGAVDPRSLRNDDMIPYALQMASSAMEQLLPSQGAKSKVVREEKIGDAECYVIEMHDETTPPEGALLWIDEKRMVILRGEQSLKTAGLTQTTRADYTTAKIDEPLPEGLFTFKPPQGAKQVDKL
jgi:outer membrane lipoprotein-sorting protein